MSNIHCYNFAVSGSSGTKKLYLRGCSDAVHVLFGHCVTKKHLIELDLLHHCVEVECKTLKEVFDENQIEECNLLKLDCEGSEFDILLNTPTAYLERIRKISMEYHDNVTDYTHRDIQRFLERLGFTVKIVSFHGPLGYLYAKRV